MDEDFLMVVIYELMFEVLIKVDFGYGFENEGVE